MEKPAEEQVMLNSSMSDDDFFKWLRSRGVSDKDCKILSGEMHYTMSLLLLTDIIPSENGVTPLVFIQSDAEDFDDIGLTKFGKKHILKLLAESN